jgi:hypothetical protein
MSKELKTDKALDKNLRPLRVGEKTSPIELAEDKVRVNEKTTFSKDLVIQGDLFIEGSTADINMTDGIEIETTTVAGHVTVRSNALSINSALYSGDGDSSDNEAALGLIPSSGMDAKVLFYDASTIRWTIGNDANDSNNLKIDAGDTTVGADTKLTLNSSGDLTTGRDITTGRSVVFDSGATTYIQESSDDVLSIYVGGDEMLKLDESVLGNGTLTSQGSLMVKERLNASADVAGQGQIWVKSSTPNELCFTDDAGTDIVGIGKYFYDIQRVGYYASGGTANYVPLTGGTIESTNPTGGNERLGFIAPYDGVLHQVQWRSEIAQNGTVITKIYEASDGTEIPATLTFQKDESINIADDTTHTVDLTSPDSGDVNLDKGKLYTIQLTHAANPYDVNATIIFRWDLTS